MSSWQDRLVGVWSPLYLKKFVFKLAMVLLIAGGLNWLSIGLFDCNLVETMFGDGVLSKLIYLLVGFSAIGTMFDRDTYLPFLGPSIVPCAALQNREPPGATKEVKIVIAPNTKVLYWAAEPAAENLKQIQSWKEAYAQYENAGVATSNGEGVAVLKVRSPQSYRVPFKGKLESHVHYRVCGDAGWLGKIETIYVDPPAVEGFECPYKGKSNKMANQDVRADFSASIF